MDIEILDCCEVTRDLTGPERETIFSLGHPVLVAAGEPILEEGDLGDGFYLLVSGRAEIVKNGRGIAEVESGAVIGEMALFNENVRTGGCRAVEHCELFFVPAPEFARLVLAQNPAGIKVIQALGRVMVRRLQQRDAALLRRAGDQDDPLLSDTLEEFATLRKRLMSDWALQYHALGRPGKLTVTPSKPVGSAADLSVAYSPGVAEPCIAIRRDPDRAYEYTARGQLVGVITNGTAVLGLGDIGAIAAKPVMEGKAVLFKRFADLDAFDIEVDEPDPAKLADIVCALGPTFGGINLEDIRAPDCFLVETECRRRLDIPVFHDDQHGTAIIAGAGLLNALELVNKSIDTVRVVFSGAGAAGWACAQYFLLLGVRRENLLLTDVKGVVYYGRGDNNYLDALAADTAARTLAEAIVDADVFVGVSAPRVLSPAMLRTMSRDPIVFALANPVPEIDYGLARDTRPDALVATGRSDYPNQINNVIAFPYIFRGALDVRARAIDDAMKQAATRAIAALAKEPASGLAFGRDYLIPKPNDRRLLTRVAPAVAAAAVEAGLARVPLDPDAYLQRLHRLAHDLDEGTA
jgi:malate dehydrogenase (oxaloacetate-decarboxylating)(NADP+)